MCRCIGVGMLRPATFAELMSFRSVRDTASKTKVKGYQEPPCNAHTNCLVTTGTIQFIKNVQFSLSPQVRSVSSHLACVSSCTYPAWGRLDSYIRHTTNRRNPRAQVISQKSVTCKVETGIPGLKHKTKSLTSPVEMALKCNYLVEPRTKNWK